MPTKKIPGPSRGSYNLIENLLKALPLPDYKHYLQ